MVSFVLVFFSILIIKIFILGLYFLSESIISKQFLSVPSRYVCVHQLEESETGSVQQGDDGS